MNIASEIFKNKTLVRLLSDATLVKLLNEGIKSVYNEDLLKEYLKTIEFYLEQGDLEGLRYFCKNMDDCRKNSLKKLLEEQYILSVMAFEQKDMLQLKYLHNSCKEEKGKQSVESMMLKRDLTNSMNNFLEEETFLSRKNIYTFDILYQIGVEVIHNFNKYNRYEVYYG